MTTTTDNTNLPVREPTAPSAKATSTAARRHTTLWLILAVGAAVRIAALLWFGNGGLYNDEQDYHELAVAIAERGEYGFRPGVLTSLRPPLYPVLVAGIYKVFGDGNWMAVRSVQAVISLATVWVVYQLALALYSQRVANWAAGLTCFYPTLIAYNSQILTETLFTCLLCASLLAIVSALQRNALSLWLTAGLLLGLGALTRSILWLLPPFIVLFVLWYGSGNVSRRIAACIIFGLAFVATLAPWAIRNTRLHETFTTVDVMGGRNLMMGNFEHTPLLRSWAAIEIQGDRSWHHVLRSTTPEAKGKTQGQIDKLAMKAGLKYMIDNPIQTAQRCGVKFVNFWQLDREIVAGAKASHFGPISTPQLLGLAALVVGAYVIIVMSGIFGIVCAPPRDWRMHVLLVMVIGFVCAIHTLTFGHSRYHVPLIPILSLYSAAAICFTAEICNRRRSWQFVLAGLLCLLLAASWVWEFAIADSQKMLG